MIKLAMPAFPKPIERIGRSGAWTTTDALVVAKFFDAKGGAAREKEIKAAQLNESAGLAFAPRYYGSEGDALYFERFPETLREWCARRGRLSAELTAQLYDRVQIMHDVGIAHRDARAENIVVREGPDGAEIKMIDFALASFADEGEIAIDRGRDWDHFEGRALRQYFAFGPGDWR